eukprot:gene34029-43967_t
MDPTSYCHVRGRSSGWWTWSKITTGDEKCMDSITRSISHNIERLRGQSNRASTLVLDSISQELSEKEIIDKRYRTT